MYPFSHDILRRSREVVSEVAAEAVAGLGREGAEAEGAVGDVAVDGVAARGEDADAPGPAAAGAGRAELEPPQPPPRLVHDHAAEPGPRRGDHRHHLHRLWRLRIPDLRMQCCQGWRPQDSRNWAGEEECL